MAAPAPAPWNLDFAGKPGGNGDINMYVVDKDGRKIAAVWGKRGEKELTGCMMSMAPDMLTALKGVVAKFGYSSTDGPDWYVAVAAAIKGAEGQQ